MKHIVIKQVATPTGIVTKRWVVHAKKSDAMLGVIQWRTGWRCYVFEPCFPTVFEQVCLRDIATFIEERTAEHKKG